MNVILYSTGCPKCNELKLLLKQNGITYTENNSVDEMLSMGFTQVPILEVDGEHFDVNAAKTWISQHKGESV